MVAASWFGWTRSGGGSPSPLARPSFRAPIAESYQHRRASSLGARSLALTNDASLFRLKYRELAAVPPSQSGVHASGRRPREERVSMIAVANNKQDGRRTL
jgi:hypothetical protein